MADFKIKYPAASTTALTITLASLADDNTNGLDGRQSTAVSNASGQSSNNAAINFQTPTADWTAGTVRIWGWAEYDAASSGNCWEWGPMTSVQAAMSGQSVSFASGALVSQIGI